jgi:DtxR family transcriptional regulator, Mn-dependent transcriptional regulator
MVIHPSQPSLSEENYVKAIYHLSKRGMQKISPTAIAEELGVNAASVVDMIKKLSDKKLISYSKGTGAELSADGKKVALHIVRNHRLWEVFLCEKLGYSWDVVHDIAEQLEHIKHNELADRLDKFLGFPAYDPHGDPIPNSNGEVPEASAVLLSEMEIGKPCKVAAVKDTSAVFLQYLEKLSVNIGTRLEVMEKISFDDSMMIRIGRDQNATVSKKFAENILVG